MLFSFAEALCQIQSGAFNLPTGQFSDPVLYLAAEARPSSEYLLNTILPNRNRADYQAKSASMTIRTIMAGLVAMDSQYPQGGYVESGAFNEQTAKIATATWLREAQLRELQQFVSAAIIRNGGQVNQATLTHQMALEAINFLNKSVIQAHTDTEEYLKGQALFTGAISWTFNQVKLEVDYGIPAANKPAQRTGNDGYGGSSSDFWSDVRLHRRLQKTGITAIIMHPETADMIQYNAANNIVQVGDGLNSMARQWRKINSQGAFTADANDQIMVYTYGAEGEIYDLSNPGSTTKVPFCPRGVMASFGRNATSNYQVGQGSTPPAVVELGYGHVGPTVEGGGTPGRWARLYTPQDRPWELRAEGAENFLPVVVDPTKIVITSTEMV